MFWAADGQDGKRFQIEKIGAIFSSLSPCVLEHSLKHIIVDSFFENSLDILLSVFYIPFCVWKVLCLNLGQFWPKTSNPQHIAPLKLTVLV